MIFSELYSAYYNAVAGILRDVISGAADERTLQKTVMRHAFSESILTILPSLKSGKWQLLKGDMSTPIRHIPYMPMTLLEKQWLKAVTLDPRIKLFDISIGGLDDIEPLFTPDDYVIYDKYSDGDPFEDERYIGNFRTILRAIHEKQPIKIETVNRKGQVIQMNVMPGRLEYSEKDDKFRLISSGCRYGGTVNLARIVSCKRYYGDALSCTAEKSVHYRSVALRISDERNALERCMLHFANFEKQAERVDNRHYILRIKYDRDDETEILIRILGFGPMVEVLEPESFINIIKERLKKQKSCGLP